MSKSVNNNQSVNNNESSCNRRSTIIEESEQIKQRIRRRRIVPTRFETKLLAKLEISENYIDINRVPHNEFATFIFALGRAGSILHRCVLQTLENARLVLFILRLAVSF